MDHDHTPGGPLDYDFITEGIYIGTNQCCMLGLAEVLKKEGITADMSLEDVRVDHPFGVSMYTWIPTPDMTPPNDDQLIFGARVLRELVRQGRKVYVHCKNGHGRASTMVSSYLITTGMTAEDAFALVKNRRPGAHLQDVQRTALKKFEALHKAA